MVIYLDTSAWLKVYVREAGRDRVEEAIVSAEIVATSTIAYAEARAGLARRMREGDFTGPEHAVIIERLGSDWSAFARAQASDKITYQAGVLAQMYSLRGCDAIHLASAMDLRERRSDMRFFYFDRRLTNAAQEAGLTVFTG